MQNITKMVIFIVIALSSFGLVIYYIYASIEQSNQNQGIQETLQTTIIANQDYSERVMDKVFYINKTKFEQEFCNELQKNKNFQNNHNTQNKTTIEFSYLCSKYSDSSEAISGVKVKVNIKNKVYQGTVVIENGKDE